ncbi:MAG TPA: glutaminase A [Candidatus Binatia bacterium]|nr:glutaminase A [Candidatus Binatia bacterium]
MRDRESGGGRGGDLERLSIHHPLATYLEELHRRHAGCADGEVASYIPELARANPGHFGIALATIDGQVYEAGDSRVPFSIQSISKPFVYALALHDEGLERVLQKIGVEPTGDAFNSISLHQDTGRPFNPMINAGAIASTGLIRGKDEAEKMERILEMFSRCAGRRLTIDETVYHSEHDTGYRNFAIGYMLRNFGIVGSAPEPVLDLYFRQCSIEVTCRDLAIMATTLANGGICPMTGETAIDAAYVPRVLSVMATCGMYDYAGEWIYRIGMPSKSGVGGGIIGVLPGHMGIAVFSPPLDARGNSVRGIRVFNDLSEDFGLHLFQAPSPVKSVVRRRFDAASVASKRIRRRGDANALAEHGHRIVVFELQGELTLFSVERVVRNILTLSEEVDYLIIDFKRVFGADRPALDLWMTFLDSIEGSYKEVILTELDSNAALAAYFELALENKPPSSVGILREADAALELCENRLLQEVGSATDPGATVELDEFEICDGLDESRIETLRSYLEKRTYKQSEMIFEMGDDANALYFLTRGQVSVTIDVLPGTSKRLTTCTPGMLFGEMAILERRPRSAAVRADTNAECYLLSMENFDRLTEAHPDLKAKLMENFARALSLRVRRLTEEVRTLSE